MFTQFHCGKKAYVYKIFNYFSFHNYILRFCFVIYPFLNCCVSGTHDFIVFTLVFFPLFSYLLGYFSLLYLSNMFYCFNTYHTFYSINCTSVLNNFLLKWGNKPFKKVCPNFKTFNHRSVNNWKNRF